VSATRFVTPELAPISLMTDDVFVDRRSAGIDARRFA